MIFYLESRLDTDAGSRGLAGGRGNSTFPISTDPPRRGHFTRAPIPPARAPAPDVSEPLINNSRAARSNRTIGRPAAAVPLSLLSGAPAVMACQLRHYAFRFMSGRPTRPSCCTSGELAPPMSSPSLPQTALL